jgi:hypothetical protein
VSPVKYELSFYISEDAILHSHRCENLKSYIAVVLHNHKRRAVLSTVTNIQGFVQCEALLKYCPNVRQSWTMCKDFEPEEGT